MLARDVIEEPAQRAEDSSPGRKPGVAAPKKYLSLEGATDQ